MAELEELFVLFLRALLEARQAERPARRVVCGWLKVIKGGKA